MESLEERLKTFENWTSNFPKKSLAKAGFVYTQKEDIVICPFCGTEGWKWEENDDPFLDHLKWSPGCYFIENVLFAVRRKSPRYKIHETLQSRLETFQQWPIGLV